MKMLWAWVLSFWTWLRTGRCYVCKTVKPRRELYEYSPFHNGKFCGQCWREMKRSDNEAWEQHLLDQEVEKEKRRLRARRIAERDVARETYREN